MKFAIVASLFAVTSGAVTNIDTIKKCTKIADCAAETKNKCCADFTGKDADGKAATPLKGCAVADNDTHTDANSVKFTAKCMKATTGATATKVGAAAVAAAAYYLA